MDNQKPLKKIHFHESFKAQEDFALQTTLNMSYEERLRAMYELNHRIYGPKYGTITKETKLFCALPGESLHDFYRRKNAE